MNNKGRKTDIVAYGQIVIGCAVFIMWMLGKITPAEIGVVLAAVAYFGNMVTSKLAKDADASHSTDKQAIGGELPPDDDEDPPPPK